jgi:hypothetical protein
MPKQRPRQRIVFCDCFDCVERPGGTVGSQAELADSEAVARQEPPPKALLIYASGFLQPHVPDSLDATASVAALTLGTKAAAAAAAPPVAGAGSNVDACVFPHLDRVVKEGALGMLSVRAGTAAGAEHAPHTRRTRRCMHVRAHVREDGAAGAAPPGPPPSQGRCQRGCRSWPSCWASTRWAGG